MAITRLTQSTLQQAFPKYPNAWDGVTAVPAMDCLGTVIVNSSGTTQISLTNIPSTYTSLQLRLFARTNRATYNIDGLRLRFNNISSTSYSEHSLTGDPSTTTTAVVGAGSASTTSILLGQFGTTVSTNTYGVGIVDIFDYKNTSKNTVVRSLAGVETNGGAAGYSGYSGLYSGAYYSTNVITSIQIISDTSATIQQFSSFALYGVK
jgi:hypothetical protein